VGSVVNPKAFRLYSLTVWNSLFYVDDNMNYSYLVHKFRNIHESVHAALTGSLNIKEKSRKKYSKKKQKLNVFVAYDNFTIRSVANRIFVFVFLRVR